MIRPLPPAPMINTLPLPSSTDSVEHAYTAYSPSPSSAALHFARNTRVKHWTEDVPLRQKVSKISFGQGVGAGSAIWSDSGDAVNRPPDLPLKQTLTPPHPYLAKGPPPKSNQHSRHPSIPRSASALSIQRPKIEPPRALGSLGHTPKNTAALNVPYSARKPSPLGTDKPTLHPVEPFANRSDRDAYLSSVLDLDLSLLAETMPPQKKPSQIDHRSKRKSKSNVAPGKKLDDVAIELRKSKSVGAGDTSRAHLPPVVSSALRADLTVPIAPLPRPTALPNPVRPNLEHRQSSKIKRSAIPSLGQASRVILDGVPPSRPMMRRSTASDVVPKLNDITVQSSNQILRPQPTPLNQLSDEPKQSRPLQPALTPSGSIVGLTRSLGRKFRDPNLSNLQARFEPKMYSLPSSISPSPTKPVNFSSNLFTNDNPPPHINAAVPLLPEPVVYQDQYPHSRTRNHPTPMAPLDAVPIVTTILPPSVTPQDLHPISVTNHYPAIQPTSTLGLNIPPQTTSSNPVPPYEAGINPNTEHHTLELRRLRHRTAMSETTATAEGEDRISLTVPAGKKNRLHISFRLLPRRRRNQEASEATSSMPPTPPIKASKPSHNKRTEASRRGPVPRLATEREKRPPSPTSTETTLPPLRPTYPPYGPPMLPAFRSFPPILNMRPPLPYPQPAPSPRDRPQRNMSPPRRPSPLLSPDPPRSPKRDQLPYGENRMYPLNEPRPPEYGYRPHNPYARPSRSIWQKMFGRPDMPHRRVDEWDREARGTMPPFGPTGMLDPPRRDRDRYEPDVPRRPEFEPSIYDPPTMYNGGYRRDRPPWIFERFTRRRAPYHSSAKKYQQSLMPDSGAPNRSNGPSPYAQQDYARTNPFPRRKEQIRRDNDPRRFFNIQRPPRGQSRRPIDGRERDQRRGQRNMSFPKLQQNRLSFRFPTLPNLPRNVFRGQDSRQQTSRVSNWVKKVANTSGGGSKLQRSGSRRNVPALNRQPVTKWKDRLPGRR